MGTKTRITGLDARRRPHAGWRSRDHVVWPAVAVLLTCLALAAATGPALAAQAIPPEQQLADRFAPILVVAHTDRACDPENDPYGPVPVDVLFGDQQIDIKEGPNRDLVGVGPTPPELFRRDQSTYLDFPGNPRFPGCTYEQYFRDRVQQAPPVAYAHVVVDPTRPGVALQYWFFYTFNDFNNLHEGDWEGIQLSFDVDSVEEALATEPARIAFAQHDGGERAAWTDLKVEKDGDHPVVYVARGSHASQFSPDVFLGYGERGSGFGCDDASLPGRQVPVQARLVPTEVDSQDDPLAWIAYDGRWGERLSGFWNGPTGPNTKPRWLDPFQWEERLRDSSIVVADRSSAGPDVADVFCGIASTGSEVLNLYGYYPPAGIATVGIVLLVAVVLVAHAWRILRAAVALYARHLLTFVLIGLLLLPLAAIASWVQLAVATLPPVELLDRLVRRSPLVDLAFALSLGSVQSTLALLLVTPAVIAVVGEIRSGHETGIEQAFRTVGHRFVALVATAVRYLAIIFVLALSIVGIPWAIRQAVRWTFVEQAVVLDQRSGKAALDASSRVVIGRWWRVLATMAVLAFIGAAIAPLIAIAVLILTPASLRFATALSSVIYAACLPLATIGTTLLYEDLNATTAHPEPAVEPAVAPA